MKDWEKVSQEELFEEGQKTIKVDASQLLVGRDVLMPFEAALFLTQSLTLAGMYSALLMLQDFDLLTGLNHEDLAKFLNLSLPTFFRYRDALVARNLIKLEVNKLNPKCLDIVLLRIPRLAEKELQRMLKTHGKEMRLQLLSQWRGTIRPLTEEERLKQVSMAREAKEQMAFETKVEEKAKEIVKKKEEAKKKDEQRFPVIDYKSVLDGYRKYKGIYFKPGSPDEARYRKAAKNMFLSGWKVLDILACLKFFNKCQNKEGYEWMSNWTLETVMKKMPEFMGGKLKLKELGDDYTVL